MDEFGTLLEQEIPRLRRYARSLTRDASSADDLVQDCLARALAKFSLWQPGTNLRAWLFTILHNQHVNKVRRSMREGISIPVEDAEASLIAAPSQGQSLAMRDLQRGLARLPDEQRTVILLIGLEGMRYEEAAQILDVPVGTVRSRLSRGRDALRMLMGITEAAEPVDQVAIASPEVFSIAAYLAKRTQAAAANASRRPNSHRPSSGLDGLSASA